MLVLLDGDYRASRDWGFAALGYLPPEFTFTRASTATYRDGNGVRQTAAIDTPRFDHDANGNPLGLLLEGARTNYLLNSTAPATQTTGSLGTGPYTLWVEGAGSAAVAGAGATITGAGTATEGSSVHFTVTVAGTVTVTKTGTLTAFQLENSLFPTSLIVTAGATATREEDLCSLALTPWFNTSEGTLFADFSPLFLGGGGAVSLSDGTSGNRLEFNQQASTVYRMIGQIGGSTIIRRDSGVITEGGTHKMAGAFKSGDSAAAFDGSLMIDNVVNATFSPLTAFDRLLPGATGAQAHGGMLLRRIAYWQKRLPDAELVRLTR